MAVKMNKIYCGDGFPNLPDFEAMESGGGGASAGLIAYEQKTLKADQAYTAGDNFIYAGTIYVATANIAKDADIVLEGSGANAEALDPVQEQINDIEASMPVAWDYSTTEVDTGQKWVDGKEIYCKVFTGLSATLVANNLVVSGADITSASEIISCTCIDQEGSIIAVSVYNVSGDLKLFAYQSGNVITKIILFYTKTA